MDPVLQGLLEELECPVCREYVVPTIAMCVSGHSICTTCRYKMYRCPVCTKTFSNSRNYALENKVGRMMYPCKYQEEGCKESLTLQQRTAHHAECPHQTHKCPFSILDRDPCRWKGSPATLLNHLETNHTSLSNPLRAVKYRTRLWCIEKALFGAKQCLPWMKCSSGTVQSKTVMCIAVCFMWDQQSTLPPTNQISVELL